MMEMHERIRELRKNHLKLSQTDFGEKLGVSRSVIKNIELNTLARPDQKLSLIKLMCKEFNVNEDWLLHGIEPMFKEASTFSLDDFAKQHGATNLELEILKAYFEIDPNIRNQLVEHFKERLTASRSLSVEEAEAAYIKSRSKFVTNKDSSALNTTENIEEINSQHIKNAANQ